ncbi:MAG TPA: hypothetical protein VIW92_16270, partial [Thermoanaerobaculia bacterium]
MRNARPLVLWFLAGAAGLALLIWAYPRALPLLPQGWTVSRDEAVNIALERLRDLGEPVEDPYIVAILGPDPLLERRLQLALDRNRFERLRESTLPDQAIPWEVYVYPRGAPQNEWTYMALISPSGEVFSLR